MACSHADVPFTTENLIIVCGHYGVGKTNFSLNLALDLAQDGKPVTLVDLDIVNPYFRSSDYGELLEEAYIDLVAPVLAGSSVDVPSLSARVLAAIERAQAGECITVIDAGGDDVGSGVLGRFAGQISQSAYTMLVVVNAYRNLTQSPEEAYEILRLIEQSSGLQASCIVNNSHIMNHSSEQTCIESWDFGEKVACLASLPCVAVCVSKTLVNSDANRVFTLDCAANLYPINVYVKPPWE